MRWFDSRISSRIYGGRYFVTSERYNYDEPRLYTVRSFTYSDGRLEIDTVGEFQQYETARQAHNAAAKLAANEMVTA